ncbi:MAG TPA: hypothetical protein VD763_07275 [Candidatus Saccharimonadales bacterium]|nr:hypothetical protein [Candidatus Saccharimonadales bacterium]
MSTSKVRPPRSGDPYGLGPVGSWLAPILSVVGLIVVAIVTLSLLGGEVPFGIGSGSGNGNGAGNGGPSRTAAPSNVVVVPDEAAFDGSIIYAKGGNIWLQTDADGARQVTTDGHDSMPSWSPDGQWIYFIRSASEQGRWPVQGTPETYTLAVPLLMRVHPDGSGEEQLATGLFKRDGFTYAYWIRQPVIAPDDSRLAVVSDAPNPDQSTVVLQFLDPETGKLSSAKMETNGVLGHQDPEWRPDGKFLLYVRNGRDGSRGAPVIMRYNVARKTARALTGFGYLNPAYSRDGRYIAATKTSAFGTNVVILDGETGQELLRVTDDGASWAPTWSPAGDGVAFLHLDGQTVDLRLAKLDGAAPTWTVSETIDLTEVSDLGPESRPDWFIPEDQLPALPTPTPAASAPAAGSPAP